MSKKVYRTARGKTVDLGALQLQNEKVRAVGNMKVNARGDLIDSQNTPIESRNKQVSAQYKKQTNVVDEPVMSSKKAAAATPAVKPVAEPAQQEPVQQEPAAPPVTGLAGGLADAIARSRQVKQEPMKTPRQLAQERAGVKKI